MEVKLHVGIFIEILSIFENRFQNKIKSEKIMSNFDIETENPLFMQDLNLNIIKLLKHEDKDSILGQIDQSSELIYLNRLNITKFEVLREKNKFMQSFKLFTNRVVSEINNRLNLFKLNGLIHENKLPHENNFNYINLNSKLEFEKFIEGLIENNTDDFFKEKEILKFIKELIILLRINKDKINCDQFNINSFLNELEERINFSFYNVRKRNYFEEDFELHKAVFENNLRMIRKICANETNSHFFCDINEMDPNGNTPLMLAIKLCNYDAINVLCDHDADIKHKCFDGDVSPMEYAIYLQNRKILKILVNAVKKQKITHWENNKAEVSKIIKSIPDFSMDLKLNFDSNIFSLFSSITPSDYYKISKFGGNVRIDMNISAMSSSFKSIKGKSSILIKEKGNNINIYKIDHEKKIVNLNINFLVV